MVDSVTLGSLRRLVQPTFQNIALAASKSGGVSLFYESVTDNITAHAGGGQASAVPLVTEVNRITVAANSGDSVMLPATTQYPSSGDAYQIGSVVQGIGQTILVINHGTNPIGVYGAGTDTIDDVATGTGVSQMNGSMVIYTCTSVGKWYSEGLATGYAGNFQTLSTARFAPSTVATTVGAVPLTAMINRVSGAADSLGAVLLPSTTLSSTITGGLEIFLINASTGSINVFPGNTLDAINALAADAAYAVASSGKVNFINTNPNQWHALLSA